MSTFIINSERTLAIGKQALEDSYRRDKFLEVSVKAGKTRTLDQNALSHVWYEQIAQELPQHSALEWKCYCKLHHGIPILRMDDEAFKKFYDNSIMHSLSYEQKLEAMKYFPVTSMMNKRQLSVYLEQVKEDFEKQDVILEFPEVLE